MGIFLQDLINVAIATHFRIMCLQKNAVLFLVFEVLSDHRVNQGVGVQNITVHVCNSFTLLYVPTRHITVEYGRK